MKKKVLGRGLGALIGGAPSAASQAQGAATVDASGKYMLCPVERIRPNKRQPRKNFDAAALAQLVDSIKENGVIEPLVVRKSGESFELIAGERRWRASKAAGLTSVPVVITDATDIKSLELAIIENIQREDLNPIEEAEAYQSLVDNGLTQEEVAKKVSKERATVTNYLRLLRLPPEIKDEVVKSSISMGHARAILSLEGHAQQRELCRQILKKGLSVRQAESLAASAARKQNPSKAGKKSRHAFPVEEELRRVFGTKVSVVDKNGKGRIEIEYYSADERERILAMLTRK
ncbi:MAG: ParB/RepB/Spo0J family partition protein [Deltaproteobacteria bacterium]|nr:ParB/RepB/Spo0J family partition protein [Deltaproteobacteria bacterium]